MIERNDPCWCGSGKKWKKCHYPEPGSINLSQRYYQQYRIILKSPEQIAGIRRACRLAARILEATCEMAKPGVTTNELNDYADKLHREANAVPAPLHYGNPPFPKSICTSLNEVICHGIPNDTPLKEGDIMNVDVSCILDGYFGDCSRMVMIKPISEERKRVCRVSYECLMQAIQILRPGIMISAIGDVIADHASCQGCSVVHQFVGHGVGLSFHEAPQIPHHRNSLKIPLAEGMTFTIEPMINAGAPEAVIDSSNSWEARTVDGRASAQWEHTVLITEKGSEILTFLES